MFASRGLERGPPDRMALLGGGQVEARVEIENLRELVAALRDAVRHAIAEGEELVGGDLRVDVGAVEVGRAVQERDGAAVVARVVGGARAVERGARGRFGRRCFAAGDSQQQDDRNNDER